MLLNRFALAAGGSVLALLLAGCQKISSIPTEDENFIIIPPSHVEVYFAQDATIIAAWDQVTAIGFSYYNVYLGTSPSNEKLSAQITESAVLFDSLSYDSTYYISVTAVYLNGVESPRSNIASAKPINYLAPPAPLGLTVRAHDDDLGKYISVIWSSDPIGDLAGYEVYRDTSETFTPDTAGGSNLVARVTTNSFTDDSALNVGTEYYYEVVAFDFDHRRSPSSAAEGDMILAKPLLLTPPSGALVNYNDILSFTFAPVKGATGYLVIVSSSPTGGELFTATLPSGQDSVVYSGSSLNLNQLYFWKVAATTADPGTPNSVSSAFSFTITQ